ncbi:protease HtpX [Salinispirillum marinum]|uniref:Protease HtpX n=2 Tax=Saccharospirillaceae TaxID=255527 RepID=A0ABV8B9W2_9GAMM
MRIMLFLLTNFAILITFGVFTTVVLPLLGIQLQGQGALLVMALFFGMGGSFISLWMSKFIAIKSTGAQVIKQPRNEEERWLMSTVARLAKQAGIGMPDVAIYGGQEVNAFATGSNRNNALVAVSVGLLRGMTKDEQEAVLAHEISHIANGDMVTLTLVQGVMNTFVIYFARVVASVVNRGGQQSGLAYFMTVMALQVVFGILASVVVNWFSRRREFGADFGAAQLVGKQKMIAALQRLKGGADSQLEGQMVAFGIKGKASDLFATHPPLDSRIEALRNL